MKWNNWIFCLSAALIALPGPVFAANTVVSGVFDGSEQRIAPLPGTCAGAPSLGYQAISGVQVTASGSYTVTDPFTLGPGDVTALLYSGSFNPNSPQANLLTPNGIDFQDEVALSSGASYVLVVQHWCQNSEGAWAVTFSGPGSVNSASAVDTPDFTEGSFSAADPTADTDCGNTQYLQTGPIRVSRSGTYHYTDTWNISAVDMCLQIYTAPFNPGSPNANRVAAVGDRGQAMDDIGTVALTAGQDYWFVAQPLDYPQNGEFFYVFAPPASLRINHGMAGAWYEPATDGQGFFMDVFDNLNLMFLAWFTFDLERPDPGAQAMIGEPGHRWMTAVGPFSGDTADMDIYWTRGMIFDSPNPPRVDPNLQDGSMTVEFFDCSTGQVTYDLGTANVQGQVPIQRIANDAVELCESLYFGPGQPGPL